MPRTPLLLASQLVDMAHKSGRRGIASRGILFPLHDRKQPGGEFLAKFDAPLVEGIDPEELGFDEYPVFVERDQTAKRGRIELAVENGDRRAVSGKDAVRRNPIDLVRLNSFR